MHGRVWEITSIAGAGRLVAAEVWAGQKLNQNSKPANTRICNLCCYCCSSQKFGFPNGWSVIALALKVNRSEARTQRAP